VTEEVFRKLCHDLCDAAGVPAPGLARDGRATTAIELMLGDVPVILAHDTDGQRGNACFTVVLGQLPARRRLEACEALLDINFQVLLAGYAFGRDPANGDVVLRHTVTLGQVTGACLYERIANAAAAARGWREHHFLMA